MAALNFPTSPALNQVFTANGKSWRWDGIAWKSFNTISISGGGTGLTSITAGNAFLSSNSAGIALTYRTFTAGTGMQITVSANDVTFAATGVSSGTVTGTGTSAYVPIWTSSGTALTDSIMSQVGNIMVVGGSIKALTKSFLIPHPLDPSKKLEHGSLEGPEHAAYQRGTASGYGDVKVSLPNYWSKLVEDDYSILLTSRCNHSLYVKQQASDSFVVSRIAVLGFSKKYIEFDYFIIGNRRDIKIIVEQ
jgi:hypothetical protein